MLKPNQLFSYWTADTVAECLEIGGAQSPLYLKLWNEIVPQHEPRLEGDFSENDTIPANNNLAAHWGKFTHYEQIKLNAAAAVWDKQ